MGLDSDIVFVCFNQFFLYVDVLQLELVDGGFMVQTAFFCNEVHFFGICVFEVFEDGEQVFARDHKYLRARVDDRGAVSAVVVLVSQHIRVSEVRPLHVHVKRDMVHLVDLSLSQIVHQLHLAPQYKKHLVSSFLLNKKPFACKEVHLL